VVEAGREPKQSVMASVVFRRAQPPDYPAILRLQSANFIANLSQEERNEGFLSAEFAPGQVAEMAEDLGTTLATSNGEVLGFLCAFRKEFGHGSPVIAKMLDTYDLIRFEDQPLSTYSSYIYGPVCIRRDYRRRGLLRGLYQAQKQDLAGQFDVGVAFVSRSNPHSLDAHIAGLGMTEVGDFELMGNVYVILAFRLPPSAS
jgi:predicted GNAT superfamily acetyltransferase